MRHALRKRYARLEDDEIHIDEIIPWGSDCLITIEFREEKYAIRTSNGMYLNKDGKLVTLPSEDTLFNIEFHKGCVAFKVRIFFISTINKWSFFIIFSYKYFKASYW